MTPKTNAAQKWFDAGAAEAAKGRALWQRARGHIIDAGLLFAKARDACGQGDWGFFLESNAPAMKPRTVQFYIQLSEAAIEWARAENPGFSRPKLEDAARTVMMQSPKPLIVLLRDLREMRPFGEYDAVKYAVRKQLGNGQQLELTFDKVWSPLDVLEHLDQANFSLIPPEGKSETEALQELGVKLARISEKVKGRLLTIEI